jgi:UDP-N-acetylmuramoylalanine-D-glutamate ligase
MEILNKKEILKYTDGRIEQIFDEEGNLISQKFKAGGDTNYYDSNSVLHHDDPRTNFYAPFDMVQPNDNLLSRIVKWNQKRNNMEFNHKRETQMLAEELYEFLGYERGNAKELSRDFSAQSGKEQFYDESGNIVLIYDSKAESRVTITKSDLADAAGDIAFIAIGTIAKLGLNPREVLERITIHNEAKGSVKDQHGKIIKDETFVEPIHG